jgi:monoamine oxidase
MLNPESNFPTGEVDIAVIGAGAAGIAAGRRLAEAGANFVVIEARSRIGGRAWTATAGGFPIDLGCGWLHSGDRNPWTEIAGREGLTIDRTPAPWTTRRDMSFSTEAWNEFEAVVRLFNRRVEAAAKEGRDNPAAEYLEAGNKWNGLIDAISTYANGAELELISVFDLQRYADDDVNWRVVEGYGAAISFYGAALPLVLDCVVTRVDHGGKQIRIETSRGEIAANAVIVALPTSLIASESVRFTPALPAKVEAAADLPLGLADKVLLAVDGADNLPVETRLFGKLDRTATGAYHLRPFGRPLIEGYFGGRLARELEQEGEGAFARFAVDELVAHLGSGMRARLRPVAASAWNNDPYARGSYSHALPGKAGSRAVLARPIDNRLFFAGEACSAESFSTAHGAFETGVAAAEAAVAMLHRGRIGAR